VNGGVLIEVADAGPGMSGEDAGRAFDRFHRAADRPDGEQGGRASGGSGLGLSIVQAIAAAHGGHAMLKSAAGAGTSVQVWIPYHPPAQDIDMTQPAGASPN
jgi:two-component system OmpR family sensor kinase